MGTPPSANGLGLHRSTRAEIDLDAFRHNVRILRQTLKPGVRLMAVVKADAYGHGALPCAGAAMEAGADVLGVGIIAEGLELRRCGVEAPIHVLIGILPDEIDDLLHHNLSTTLCTRPLAEALAKRAAALNQSADIHIKVDTGMGRLGVSWEELPAFLEFIRGLKTLNVCSVFTHLSSADEDADYTHRQLQRMDQALQSLHQRGLPCPPVHCDNSAGLLNFPESQHDMVRLGIALYGVTPPALPEQPARTVPTLRSVMHWKTRVLRINPLPANSYLSYGRRFVTERDSRIAVLPVGYADGLSRSLSGNMDVLVGGRRAPQVGAICMDMCLVDVTDLPPVQEGDEVVLFGRQGEAAITVEEMSARDDTIPYETLCSVGKRVPRVYIP
ncbi:alanine racemase [Nitrospina watsonii]|uniref:Alanine racemase n=1 Tax=Nitrospina watsonii TaxID=1323948 RepID=A0ABM9HD93_9BACT|nr:alanine racemase [Nitrospina watsonii]CAI2718155.1 Alanine racemase [Nitrospina watsonii]